MIIFILISFLAISFARNLDLACKFTLDEYDFDLTSLDKVNPESQYEVGNVHWKFCSHLWFADSFAYVYKPSLFSNKAYKLITSPDYAPFEVLLIKKELPANQTDSESGQVHGISLKRNSDIKCYVEESEV